MGDDTVTATCGCGTLNVTLSGISKERHLCCCVDCQRRTGSAFGVSWYYPDTELIAVSGPYETFERIGTRGTHYHFHYCPSCGTTVFWHVDGEGEIGVAAGCIPPAHHIGPQDVVWVSSKPQWYAPPLDLPWYSQGHASEIVHRPDE